MRFPFYIAKRYLFSKSSNNTINIITIIAAIGVIVGTLALFIVLSGFSGLRTFSIGFLDVSDPDLKISSKTGKTLQLDDDLIKVLSNHENIAAYFLWVDEVLNAIEGLGESMENKVIVRKILRSLPMRFNAKVLVLEERSNLENVSMDELHGILTS